jgi:hypothetical protein
MAARRSVNFPGFNHHNPIPNAIGSGHVMLSVIAESIPGTRDLPLTLKAQAASDFGRIRSAVEAAGDATINFLVKGVFRGWQDNRSEHTAMGQVTCTE